jgi:PEP-CTERM motif
VLKTRNLLIMIGALAVCGNASTLGGQVLAIPGTTWSFGFSDQLGGADTDFGAAAGTISFDSSDVATLDYISSASSDIDLLRVATLGDFGVWLSVGQSETFKVHPDSPDFPIIAVQLLDETIPYPQLSTGPGDLNPDGYPHAVVSEIATGPAAVPEPGSWVLILAGAALIGFRLTAKRVAV